ASRSPATSPTGRPRSSSNRSRTAWRCAWRCCTCWREGALASWLLRNGRVVDPSQGLDGPHDILIVNGRIAELRPVGSRIGGAVAVSDDGRPVSSSHLMRMALEYTRLFDIPVINHCEDRSLSAGGVMNEGTASTLLGLKGIPAASESIMVARDLRLLELTGGR